MGKNSEILNGLPTPTSSEIQPDKRYVGEEVAFLSLPPSAIPSSPKDRPHAPTGRRRIIQQKLPTKQRRGGESARRIAHSAIERQRRNKMNDCFHTLKEMIPSCRGQELHKLDILQGSIEYMQYLVDLTTDANEKGNGQDSEEAGKALLMLHRKGLSVKDLLE